MAVVVDVAGPAADAHPVAGDVAAGRAGERHRPRRVADRTPSSTATSGVPSGAKQSTPRWSDPATAGRRSSWRRSRRRPLIGKALSTGGLAGSSSTDAASTTVSVGSWPAGCGKTTSAPGIGTPSEAGAPSSGGGCCADTEWTGQAITAAIRMQPRSVRVGSVSPSHALSRDIGCRAHCVASLTADVRPSRVRHTVAQITSMKGNVPRRAAVRE